MNPLLPHWKVLVDPLVIGRSSSSSNLSSGFIIFPFLPLILDLLLLLVIRSLLSSFSFTWSLDNSHPSLPVLSTHRTVVAVGSHTPLRLGECGIFTHLHSELDCVVDPAGCSGICVLSRKWWCSDIRRCSLFMIPHHSLRCIQFINPSYHLLLSPLPLTSTSSLEHWRGIGPLCSGGRDVVESTTFHIFMHAQRAESMEKCVDYRDSLWSSVTGIPTKCVQSHLLLSCLCCLLIISLLHSSFSSSSLVDRVQILRTYLFFHLSLHIFPHIAIYQDVVLFFSGGLAFETPATETSRHRLTSYL